MAAETRTLLFSYAVRGGFNGDLDTDGISWNANVIGLNGGTITEPGNPAIPGRVHERLMRPSCASALNPRSRACRVDQRRRGESRRAG